MIVVSDTSPLNYLVLIGHMDVLPSLFGSVIVPTAVMNELSDSGSPPLVLEWTRNLPSWVGVRTPLAPVMAEGIDLGEAQAIAIAREINADVLLIDDATGRRFAIEAGLRARGTLGVLALAAERGMLTFESALDKLADTNFRASPTLLRQLRERFRTPG